MLHRGRVSFQGGAGAAGALVFVRSGTGATPEIAVRCDEAGGFRLALPPGRYVIGARAADGRTGTIETQTGAQAQTIEIGIPD